VTGWPYEGQSARASIGFGGRDLAVLVDFHLWCLGQDIRYGDGNLLLSYGAERERPPAGIEGSSRYTIIGPDTSALFIWGFAFVLRAGDGPPTMLRRHQFSARLLTSGFHPPEVWRATDLPRGVAAREEAQRRTVAHGMEALAARLADYERWVHLQAGPDWRLTCYARMPRAKRLRTPRAPAFLAESWSSLCSNHHARPSPATPSPASPHDSPLALSA